MKLFMDSPSTGAASATTSFQNTVKSLVQGWNQFVASNGEIFNALFKMKDRRKYQPNLALWDTRDPRIDLALFQSNVPSFVINQDQRFLDWNIAFDLAFSELSSLKKGSSISSWFEHLDNFRSVPKRVDRLYGEAVLPICDRERVTYKSKKFGRMVFTKIMSPIVDRTSGKIIGWTVALNINSITKRHEFFEELYHRIEQHERHVRYIAAYDNVYGSSKSFHSMVEHHLFYAKENDRVLEIGGFNGSTTKGFLSLGSLVTTVDSDVESLRNLRDKVAMFRDRIRIVKRSLKSLSDLPKSKFDIVSLGMSLHKFPDLEKTLHELNVAMKSDGRLLISLFHEKSNLDTVFKLVRDDLEKSEKIDTIKYQYNHVMEYERDLFNQNKASLPTRTSLSKILSKAGFRIEHANESLWDGQAIFLVARKLDF